MKLSILLINQSIFTETESSIIGYSTQSEIRKCLKYGNIQWLQLEKHMTCISDKTMSMEKLLTLNLEMCKNFYLFLEPSKKWGQFHERFIHTISISMVFLFFFFLQLLTQILPWSFFYFCTLFFSVFLLTDFFSSFKPNWMLQKSTFSWCSLGDFFFSTKWCVRFSCSIYRKNQFSQTSIFHAHRFRTCSSAIFYLHRVNHSVVDIVVVAIRLQNQNNKNLIDCWEFICTIWIWIEYMIHC